MAETLRQLDDNLSAVVASYAQSSHPTTSKREGDLGTEFNGISGDATPPMMVEVDHVDVSTEEEDNVSEVMNC